MSIAALVAGERSGRAGVVINICLTFNLCLLSLRSSSSRMVEYSLDLQNINLSAIRTVRVLRPLKAINRVPSKDGSPSPFAKKYIYIYI